jgi:hypothetical protein
MAAFPFRLTAGFAALSVPRPHEEGKHGRQTSRRPRSEERPQATLLGVYSDPKRDPRFHAVTVVLAATVSEPMRAPMNPLEILEVRCFDEGALPAPLSHGLDDVLARARRGETFWE